MIRRVGEKETGTPLLNSISKMSFFRLFCSCLTIELVDNVQQKLNIKIYILYAKMCNMCKNYKFKISQFSLILTYEP